MENKTEMYLVGYQVICTSCMDGSKPQVNQSFRVTAKDALEYAEGWRKHYESIRNEIVHPSIGYDWTIEFAKVCVYDVLPVDQGKVGIYYISEEEIKSRSQA